ncbi:MAG: helix-turn-helix domain-containing protein [Victivallales bacterium]|nr:helix-turn-helix domain-containing protein [Victivallales bacterium]
MKISNLISKEALRIAVSVLSPYIPELNAPSLVAALKEYNATSPQMATVERPLTYAETAALLKLSRPTIMKLAAEGKIRRIAGFGNSVRFDPASVRRFLGQEVAP